jgi:hypothetical protein
MISVESRKGMDAPSGQTDNLSEYLLTSQAIGAESGTTFETRLRAEVSITEVTLAELVARARPEPFRAFDQIPMCDFDLARQARLVAPLFADQQIVFVGDMDGAASLLGLIAVNGGPRPAGLFVLDFDARVLEAAEDLAARHGFSGLLRTRLYNCFDPVPSDLLGTFDWFYINPPYGSHNRGESARLFLTRGCELVRARASGCLIFPDDPSRPWTRNAMAATQEFLIANGWMIQKQIDQLHRYHLDDDPGLSSSLLIVDQVTRPSTCRMPFAGRRVGMNEVAAFYGRAVLPPYPKAIDREGRLITVESMCSKLW